MTDGAPADPDEPSSGSDDRREVDIEDQGQLVEATGDVDPDLETVDADAADPGPESSGAREATRSGDEPTVDGDARPGSEG